MIVKHKKMITLAVIFTLFWMVQVSGMPLHAGGAPANEKSSITNDHEAPGMMEKEASSAVTVKKASVLPYILIGVGVAAIAAVLFFVVVKTNYDITGNWVVNHTITKYTYHMHFTGSKTSGTVTMDELLDKGAYTVDGKSVTFYGEYTGGGWNHIYSYTGTFSDKDNMSGTVIHLDRNTNTSISGTWTAKRE